MSTFTIPNILISQDEQNHFLEDSNNFTSLSEAICTDMILGNVQHNAESDERGVGNLGSPNARATIYPQTNAI